MNTTRAFLGAVALALAGASSARAQGQQLTLQQAIARAMAQGVQARSALDTRDAARARDRQFGASLLPQVSLTGTVPSYNRSIIPVIQPDGSTLFHSQQQNSSALTMNIAQRVPFTGGDLFVSSALSRVQTTIGTQDAQRWSSTPFTIGIRQPLLRTNAAAWDARSQNIRADASERQYLESREDVAITVTNAFFDAYTSEVTLGNAIKNAGIYDTLNTLNKGRYEVGRIGQNDFENSYLQLLRARSSVDAARIENDRAMANLRIQLRMAPGEAFSLVVPSTVPTVVADTAIAVAQALRNSSTIRTLEAQDVDARRRVSEARFNTGFGGTLQASVGFNQTGPEMDAVYKDLLQAQQYTVSVTFPIWQWGSRGSMIQAAKAEQDRTLITTQQSREQLALDAKFAALQLDQSKRSFDLAAQGDTVGAKVFEIATRRYLISRIDLNTFIQAQNSKDQAVVAYLQAMRAYWNAYYRLRRVTLYDFEAGAPLR